MSTRRVLERATKRALDIAVAAVGLLVLSPIMLFVTLAILLFDGRPILFRQERPGRDAALFVMIKFRTMRSEADDGRKRLSDTQRLTRLGRILRRYSLDELPQLINVLRGDMSLVGPRPLLPRYLEFYTPAERARFSVRPGITGWAQVNGRNSLSWNDRLGMDTWYASNWSLTLDLKILGLTLQRVFNKSGVEVDPSSTMLDLDEERQRNET